MDRKENYTSPQLARFYAQVQMEARVIVDTIPEDVFSAARAVRRLNESLEHIQGPDESKYGEAYYCIKTLIGADEYHKLNKPSFAKGKSIYFDEQKMNLSDESAFYDFEYYMGFITLIADKFGIRPEDIDDYFQMEADFYARGLRMSWPIQK